MDGSSEIGREEARFREVFRTLHADHLACAGDEWLTAPCTGPDGKPVARPIVWSRRNGPWTRVEVLWVGAAPGNRGGRGSGDMGAHGTRIPFGGDVAGANLDVLLGSIGLDRNTTFITAALNQLPARGGGEPTPAEIVSPAGNYRSSLHALRDTVLAAGPRLIVALGNVALRATVAAGVVDAAPPARKSGDPGSALWLPTAARLEKLGFRRGEPAVWTEFAPPDPAFVRAWHDNWGDAPLPAILWLTHPSAQNMSPFAGRHTAFHRRMVEARDALRGAACRVLGREPPRVRPEPPATGIYALPEWVSRIGPYHARLDRLWREHGL